MPPIIDIEPLLNESSESANVALEIGEACRNHGFFYITGHGVDEGLQLQLEKVSRRFFEQPESEKLNIRMSLGGRAWRGYFPVGDELTSGKPDLKEGLYFGAELDANDDRVRAGLPLHGPNLFPENMPEMRSIVLAYLDAMTHLGHSLMRGIALSLGLQANYFYDRYTADPLTLFRIFHYPASPLRTAEEMPWGVGEHTDYGVLTILKQDDVGGLQVKSKAKWIPAPPVPGAFVCNIGDMLDRLTGGLYRSTPHRVLNTTGRGRYSFPFFFDPNFDAQIQSIEIPEALHPADDQDERWDRQNVHLFEGTYGEYILSKVAKVFPDLQKGVL